MKKVIITLAVLLIGYLIVSFLVSASNNVSKDEANQFAQPIVVSVLEYKKVTKRYPSSLMEIENFPYKIKPFPSPYKSIYRFDLSTGYIIYDIILDKIEYYYKEENKLGIAQINCKYISNKCEIDYVSAVFERLTGPVAIKEAENIMQPVINFLNKYKKNGFKNIDTKGFPFEVLGIKPPDSKPISYYFEEENGLILDAGGFETGLSRDSGFVYRIQISFAKSRGSGSITSIFVGFREDGSYETSYTSMPPAFRQ